MDKFEPHWAPVIDVLQRRTSEGKRARFWLRDDDAVEPTAALERLLTLCNNAGIPLVLAVIPEPTGESLAGCLKNTGNVSVVVHGWAHRNHAGPGEKKQELGLHRGAETVLSELKEGLAKLKTLHGERAVPMLVPPWNRIAPPLIPELERSGFEALSTYGPPKAAPIRIVNCNVDLIDWHGTRRCQDHAMLANMIAEQMERMEPVGILGHHLVHDESAWLFLEQLFSLTRSFEVEWLSGRELLKDPA